MTITGPINSPHDGGSSREGWEGISRDGYYGSKDSFDAPVRGGGGGSRPMPGGMSGPIPG